MVYGLTLTSLTLSAQAQGTSISESHQLDRRDHCLSLCAQGAFALIAICYHSNAAGAADRKGRGVPLEILQHLNRNLQGLQCAV